MTQLTVTFEPYAEDSLKQIVISGVDNHNIAATGHAAYYPVGFYLRDEQGEVLGGLLGEIWGLWLHVTYLWVAEPARRAGNGSRLVAAAEQYAVERGCTGAMLGSYSFQARPFYEKLGYRVFAELEGNPAGHSLFFLKKQLARPST
jgi:GNAT superfamily N-acetyltransferase